MIEIENICKSYGTERALQEVSFKVNKGELFGVIGPDGAGKTSLFRILVTLLLPDSGKVTINGFDLIDDFKTVRRITGYMPGRFSLYQDLTVFENLSFYATVFGTSVKENYDMIKDIYWHIEPFKDRKAGKLSGGMKQKLALSCALIHRPEILILDEPTTGVDAVSRKEFWELLLDIKKKEITIMVSTPYMDEANLCDRVALMQTGRILSIEAPEAIRKQYQYDLLAVKTANMFKLLRDLERFDNRRSSFLFGQEVHLSLYKTENTIEELERFLSGIGHEDIAIRPIGPGIEDCFMELMTSKQEGNHYD